MDFGSVSWCKTGSVGGAFVWLIPYLDYATLRSFSRLPSGNGHGGECIDLPQTLLSYVDSKHDMPCGVCIFYHRYNQVTLFGRMTWRD